MHQRMAFTLQHLPFFVCVQAIDSNNIIDIPTTNAVAASNNSLHRLETIVGYTAASYGAPYQLTALPSLAWSVEIAIYVSPAHQRRELY